MKKTRAGASRWAHINTYEQKAGQRLMVGFDGKNLNEDLMFLIDTIKVGGIILFSRNISAPDQVKDLCSSVQEYAKSCGQPPLFVGIDQEGGQVARLKEPFAQFPGNPEMKGVTDARHFAEITAKELATIGINMNMAPVMDVAPKEIQSVMAERVFGCDPEWVSKLGVEVIEHMQQDGIMAVAKHFPGIGRIILDPHDDLPTLSVEISDMESFDFPPFEAAIKHDVAGIMLSHILYDKIDSKWPASLSKCIASDLLRKRMGFDKIVITDDLDMGSIDKHYEIKTIIRQILLADIDISLICHPGPNVEKAFEEILNCITGFPDIKAKTEESIRRIMKMKRKYLNLSQLLSALPAAGR